MFSPEAYHYDLPEEYIAQHPCVARDGARLLVVDDTFEDRYFKEIDSLIPPGALLVVNDTHVMPARLHARKPSGGVVEILLLAPESSVSDETMQEDEYKEDLDSRRWTCLVRKAKSLSTGMRLRVYCKDASTSDDGPEIIVVDPSNAEGLVCGFPSNGCYFFV